MKKYSKKILLVNTLGTLGYLSCILLWGWVALLYLPMALENKIVEDFLLPTPAEEVARQPIVSEASPFMMIFAGIVTVLVIIATIIILIKIPATVARTGKTVTTKAADSAIPIITKGHPLPPAKKKLLTAKLIRLFKLILVLIPIGGTLLGGLIELPLPFGVILAVSSILSLISLAWFSLQYIFAGLLKVDSKQLV